MDTVIVPLGPDPGTPSVLTPETTDSRLVELWLHGRPVSTVTVYLFAVNAFMADVGGRPLRSVTLADLQNHADGLAHLRPATRGKRLAALKSLFTFASKLGYLPLDPARALRLPKRPDTLAGRILAAETIGHVLAAEPDPRRRLLLRFLYATGGRVAESVAVRWEDCHPHETAAVVTFQEAKGGKPRTVRLPVVIWQELAAVRPEGGVGFVFASRRSDGRPIDPATAWRWAAAAGRRVGVKLSPHWFRHAHASHALDRGAPVHLVAATLGHSSLTTTSKYAHARPGESSGDFLDLADGTSGT